MKRQLSNFAVCATSICALLALCSGAVAQQDGSENTDASEISSQAPSGWKTMHYLDVPLKLTVKNGEESVLRFPWAVEPGISSEMVGMLDQPRAIGDTFYLTPASPFDYERFTFLSPKTGAIILIDIRSTDKAMPVRVIVNDARGADVESEMQSSSPSGGPAVNQQDESYQPLTITELARFGMQMVYSPDPLIDQLTGLTEVTARSRVVVHDLVPGALVEAVQWKEWRTSDGRYLNVLSVINKGSSEVSLDPTFRRHSRYEIASTPYSSMLAPYGMPGDETTLVIISSVPWNDAISLSLR